MWLRKEGTCFYKRLLEDASATWPYTPTWSSQRLLHAARTPHVVSVLNTCDIPPSHWFITAIISAVHAWIAKLVLGQSLWVSSCPLVLTLHCCGMVPLERGIHSEGGQEEALAKVWLQAPLMPWSTPLAMSCGLIYIHSIHFFPACQYTEIKFGAPYILEKCSELYHQILPPIICFHFYVAWPIV